MATFLVTLTRSGPQYRRGAPADEQTGWAAHAGYLDELVDRGVIVLGGPLADDHRVLLVIEAGSPEAVRGLLAADPWLGSHLVIDGVQPWTIRLDGRRAGIGAPAEPVTPRTPRPVTRPTQVQRWEQLTFLHWPVDPALVAPYLPAGTRPDTMDGTSYVGLVPFRMVGVGPGRGPGVPYLGTFCETNVRLYSVDRAGRRGVVFVSLDAARLLPVLTGRLAVRLPYLWAAMRIRRNGDVLSYTSRRRGRATRAAGNRTVVRIGEPIARPGPLEHFLTARWGLHVGIRGRTRYLPNEHPQWPLHRAELLDFDDDLLSAGGLPQFDAPVSVLYSPGVPVRFGRSLAVPAEGWTPGR